MPNNSGYLRLYKDASENSVIELYVYCYSDELNKTKLQYVDKLVDDLLSNNDISVSDGYITGDGNIASAVTNGEKVTNFISISNDKRIDFSMKFSSNKQIWFAYGLYDANKKFIKRVVVVASITFNGYTQSFYSEDFEGATYVRFTYRTYGEFEKPFLIYTKADALSKAIDEITKINPIRMDRMSNVKSVNHRGYNNIAPENTLPAYVLSAQKGFKYVETDVQFTKDGVAVILHDDTVDRTSNGSGAIASMTFEEVRALDFGSWKSTDYVGTKIPTLDEFLMCCKSLGLFPYIELKSGMTQARVNNIVASVKKYGMRDNTTYISFGLGSLGFVKNADSHARLGLVKQGTITEDIITSAESLKNEYNEVFIDAEKGRTDAEIQLAIDADIPVEYWTVGADTIKSANPYISGFTSNADIASNVLYDSYSIPTN